MAERGAPLGNTNNTKNRLWRQALDKRLKEYNKGSDSTAEHYWALQEIADKLIELAIGGDMQAIREMGDRIDGKVAQVIAGDSENPIAIEEIQRVIVNASSHFDGEND